jgi:hypothetical protein
VPFHTGAVIVGTWEQHTSEVLELIRQCGIDGQLVFNRGALMVLPSGINKAVGIRRALDELGRSERNLIAFGDAENDIPMLVNAETGVAARGSVPAVMALVDDRLSQAGGAGVAVYIRKLLEHGGVLPTSRRRAVVLGKNSGGTGLRFPLPVPTLSSVVIRARENPGSRGSLPSSSSSEATAFASSILKAITLRWGSVPG